MTPELILAIWGAVLSTILAVKEIRAVIRDRPDVQVAAAMTYAASSEGADSHGTLFLDGANMPPAWKEANIEITVKNHGEKPAHIQAICVEDEANVILITPAGLPCEIPPKASQRFLIQPEVVAMRTPGKVGEGPTWVVWPLVALGVVDGLGRKYVAPRDQLSRIVKAVHLLPLRFIEDQTSEPGYIRWQLQMRDEGRFFSKREEFLPNPVRNDKA